MTDPDGKRIAVLGAGGFLGSHLCASLAAEPRYELSAVDLTLQRLQDGSPHIERVQASVQDAGLIDWVTAEHDVVLSLTALCNPALYNTEPAAVIAASYDDLVPLVRRCAERGRRLIHFSTCEVYGRFALDPNGTAMPAMVEDDTALLFGPVRNERWSYACAKQLLERLIWAMGRHHGLAFTIVRPFNVIGPRMDFIPGIDGEGTPRVLACFLHALMTGQPLRLVDGGHQRRCFIGVDDFVAAVSEVLQRPRQCVGQIINVGNPHNDVSIRELATLMVNVYQQRTGGRARSALEEVSAASFYGEGYDDTTARVPDISRATTLLDWLPTTTLAELLPPIIDDYVGRYASRLVQAHGIAEECGP